METCETCRWFVSGDNQPRGGEMFSPDDGECRKNAPIGGNIVNVIGAASLSEAQSVSSLFFPWASVHRLDFCGEHQPLPKGPSDE